MNAFVKNIANQETTTTNGMPALKSSASACVDLFYAIGASRGKHIIPQFAAAYEEDQRIAGRIALYARDVRQGMGEREIFRSILRYLENRNPDMALAFIAKVEKLGRWDDLLVFSTDALKRCAYAAIRNALISEQSALCAKWMPRKGKIAEELRSYLGMTPKQYRKTLVTLTKVVETQMCAKEWDSINFSHVPSVAASRYRKAFFRNSPAYAEYVSKLAKGDTSVKINAAAIYPHEVIKGLPSSLYYTHVFSKTEREAIVAQWNALPNLVGNASILPLVDVSGSMCVPAGTSKSVQCIDVAVALGLYLSDKNTGAFKDTFMTFSTDPELLTVKGDVVSKMDQMVKSSWSMSTNISKAMDKILSHAKAFNVPQSDMPKTLLILSDMQFDRCTSFEAKAQEVFQAKFAQAGYEMPRIVFWNLSAHSNVPVKSTESGVALVSGYSPNILKAILSDNLEEFTPEAIMLKAVMSERYDF